MKIRLCAEASTVIYVTCVVTTDKHVALTNFIELLYWTVQKILKNKKNICFALHFKVNLP